MNQAVSHTQLAQALNTYPSEILGPMTVAELRAAIEQPAIQQGVALEDGLTDRILKELENAPGYLPLLEFALTQLWEQYLTHAAYNAMGGVKQALAHHADTVRQQLPSAQQHNLRRVLVQLVRPGEGTEDTRQVATRQQIGEDNWLLVKQLADKRLVVTGRDKETQQETVEVVHEALIRHWQPLREWLSQDRSFRLWQNELRRNLASWEQTGKDEGALLRGTRLAEAQEKLQERQAELSIPEQAYIQTSVALQTQEINRNKQLQRRIMGGLVSFLIIVLLLAGAVGWQWWQAEQRTTEALRNQSYALAALAKIEIDKGDTTTGILLALEALPKSIAQPDRPYVGQAMEQLSRGLIQKRERFIFQHDSAVNYAAFSPDGQQLVTVSDDGTAKLWSVSSGQLLHTFQGHKGRVIHADFNPDGQQIVTASEDGTAKLWAVSSGQLLHTFRGHEETVSNTAFATFSPDGQQLVTASWDNTAKLWAVSSGQLLHTFQEHDSWVTHAAFSPDGQQLVTASEDGTAKLWAVSSGQLLHTFRGHEKTVSHATFATFSPDGQQLVTAFYDGDDGTAKLWAMSSGQLLHTFQGHSGRITHVAFSPDRQQLVTASRDNTAKLWAVSSGVIFKPL